MNVKQRYGRNFLKRLKLLEIKYDARDEEYTYEYEITAEQTSKCRRGKQSQVQKRKKTQQNRRQTKTPKCQGVK